MYSEPILPIHPTKRVTDILVSIVVLLLSLPIIAPAAVFLYVEHALRGNLTAPLFYRETRFSQGKPFRLLKFNIFKQDVIDGMNRNGIFIHTKNLEHNGSILRTGWLLKQVYLDELPQFINILRGDMSLVGPRPLNREVYEMLLNEGIVDRNIVKAGLTGNFQSFKNVQGKTSHDLDTEYVQYLLSNPWYKVLLFDFRIMLRTLKVLIRAQGI